MFEHLHDFFDRVPDFFWNLGLFLLAIGIGLLTWVIIHFILRNQTKSPDASPDAHKPRILS